MNSVPLKSNIFLTLFGQVIQNLYIFFFTESTSSSQGLRSSILQAAVNAGEATGGPVPPGGLVVTSVDEVPPPSYTTVSGGTPVVTCRVCQVWLNMLCI